MRATIARLLPGLAIGLAAGLVHAQQGAPDGVSARSVSGQFTVQGESFPTLPARVLSLSTNREYVFLEPNLVTVSCERIKQMVWHNLGVTGPWQGKIFVYVRPAQGADDGVWITSSYFRDGWQYQVNLPNLTTRRRYVQGMVEAVLMEYAQRQASARGADIPLWLSQGLASQVLAAAEREVILPPPAKSGGQTAPPVRFVTAKKENPLESAQKVLSLEQPLSFEQLSWPGSLRLEGADGALYGYSAQCFLYQLYSLQDGRACLRSMLENLPNTYNWQIAFLRAFHGYFSRPLDVEKWWAVRSLQFSGRGSGPSWSREESYSKLAEALWTHYQTGGSTNETGHHLQANLQTVVQSWDPLQQKEALTAKIRQLEVLQLRLSSDLAPMAIEYRNVLNRYCQDHLKGNKLAWNRSVRRGGVVLARKLDELDRRFTEARPLPGADGQALADHR